MWDPGLGSVFCSVRISGAAWLWQESPTLRPLRFSRWHGSLCTRGGAPMAEEAQPLWISVSALSVPGPSLKMCSNTVPPFPGKAIPTCVSSLSTSVAGVFPGGRC